mmetsp:Transcript_35276/g.89830  ORF Transcript_35276/g.89830 Transcript_35276/m.89830 type:complete len:745 (+) Transcript_35276:75-2309(+)
MATVRWQRRLAQLVLPLGSAIWVCVASAPAKIGTHNGGEPADSEVELHCCFAPKAAPVLLACEASEDDAISDVPFALLADRSMAPPWNRHRTGLAGERAPVCGEDEAPDSSSSMDISDAVRNLCVGRRQCIVDAEDFAAGGSFSEVLVRWTCHSDGHHLDHEAEQGTADGLPPLPLRAKGPVLVDASGDRFRLLGVNWAGAHIAGAPAGLDRAPLRSIAKLVRQLGFNIVRLPFSVENVLSNRVPEEYLLAANPRLRGLPMLDVLEEVVQELGRAGVLVWLDCHMLDADWCCQTKDCNGFWYNERYSTAHWVEALRRVARHFAGVPTVVGMGLHNEPRTLCGGTSWDGAGEFCDASFYQPGESAHACIEMNWSSGPEHLQLKPAMELAGTAVLDENPRLLVSVSGLKYSQDLSAVRHAPIDLPRENLVYEAHEYSWYAWSTVWDQTLEDFAAGDDTVRPRDAALDRCWELGPACAGITCVWQHFGPVGWRTCTVRSGRLVPTPGGGTGSIVKNHADINASDHNSLLDAKWGYILQEGIAPVWVSEFGFAHDWAQDFLVDDWLARWSKYVHKGGPLKNHGGLDWSYWELAGEQIGGTSRSAGDTETFGIVNHCWTSTAKLEHFEAVRRLMGEEASVPLALSTGGPAPSPLAPSLLALTASAVALFGLTGAWCLSRRAQPRSSNWSSINCRDIMLECHREGHVEIVTEGQAPKDTWIGEDLNDKEASSPMSTVTPASSLNTVSSLD